MRDNALYGTLTMTQQFQTSVSNAIPISAPALSGSFDTSPGIESGPETTFEPTAESASPAYSQLVQEIINQIRANRLKPGDPLQSTRELAVQLNISRGIVRRAYQELLDRGFIESKPGSKTVVRDVVSSIPLNSLPLIPNAPSSSIQSNVSRILPLSQWRERAWDYLSTRGSRNIDSLSEESEFERLGYAICTYLLRYKGIRCDADQLNIFANRQQAMQAVATQLGANQIVAIDNTTDPVTQKIFTARGAALRSINTETAGTSLSELNAIRESCKIFLTMPSDEYLHGRVMPANERLEILHWARQRGVAILEEAGECENQYYPTQVPSLYELSGGVQVNYLYSFGKMLHPLTDITIIVAASDFSCNSNFAMESSRPSLTETAILADLIVDGAMDSFIRRRQRHYRKLRQAAYFETTVTLGRFIKISPPKCAHHLVLDFPAQWSTEHILDSANSAKLSLTKFADYHRNGNHVIDQSSVALNETFSVHANRFLLNFLCQSPEEAAEKIRHFASILRQ